MADQTVNIDQQQYHSSVDFTGQFAPSWITTEGLVKGQMSIKDLIQRTPSILRVWMEKCKHDVALTEDFYIFYICSKENKVICK